MGLKRREKIKRRNFLKRLGIAGGSLLLLFGIVTLLQWNLLRKQQADLIYDNVYFDSVDVSGMTKEEAKKAVEAKLAEYGEQTLCLSGETESAQTTLGELGLQVEELEKRLEEAVDYGKKGTIWKRYFQVWFLRKHTKVFSLQYAVTEDVATETLKQACEALETPAVDATIHYSEAGIEIIEGEDGIEVDTDVVVSNINSFLQEQWTKAEGGTIEATMKVAAPRVTAEDLQDVKDVLGVFQTDYSGSDSGRANNIQTGGSYINGTTVFPGEEFSTDTAMRPYTKERGYVEAASYENGAVVETLGGGICQISSTLYNAVLFAELEVTQRQAHSMLVSYVKPGKDAAIADDVKDFKFRNNLDTPIYIICDTSGSHVTITILGKETRAASRTVAFESETLESIEAGVKYVASTEETIGTMYTESSGHDGAEAKLWKIIYENGTEVERQLVNTSSYAASDQVIQVGVHSENDAAATLVNNAIATQDEAQIKEAIAQAKELEKSGEQ